MIVGTAGTGDLVDLDVVHHGRITDIADHLSNVIGQGIKGSLVLVVLKFYLLHEVGVLAESFIDRSLVFRDVGDKAAFTASAVTIGAVVSLTERTVPIRGTHGIIQIPHGAGEQLVVIGITVAVEEDAAGADIVALDVLMHEIHLGEALDVYIVGVVLALGVITVGRADSVPGVLQPGLDRPLCYRVLIFGALVQYPIHSQQAVADLLDGDAVIAGGPAGGFVQTGQGELRIAAVFNAFQIIVFLYHEAGFCHERVRFGRNGIAALILAVHPHVGGSGILTDADLVRQMETGTVAQQAVVKDLGEDGPLFGGGRIDAGKIDLGAQSDIIGALVAGQ